MEEAYKETGFIYERYSAEDGSGQGAHPYPGAGLVVLALAK